MAFVPVPNCAWATVFMFDLNTRAQNGLYFRRDAGGLTYDELVPLAEAVIDWHASTIMPSLGHNLMMSPVIVTALDTEPGEFASAYRFPAVRGGVMQNHLPLNCTLHVNLRTGIAGRAYQGANNISGIPLTMFDREALDGGFAADIVAGYELLPAALPDGWTWVVVSRHIGGVDRTEGIMTPVTDITVRDPPIVSSWRSRLYSTSNR